MIKCAGRMEEWRSGGGVGGGGGEVWPPQTHAFSSKFLSHRNYVIKPEAKKHSLRLRMNLP